MITVDFTNRGRLGLSDYLTESIKHQILDGTLKPEEKLPSKRSLAEHLGISVITVQNSYGRLIDEGFIYSEEKKGFFVTKLPLSAAAFNNFQQKKTEPESPEKIKNQNLIADFRNNATSFEKFPFSLWSHLMRQVLNSGDEKLLSKVSAKGVWELRSAISAYLRAFRNMNVNPEQIVIGAGAESLYSMIVQLSGREKIFACENPGYRKAFSVFSLNGVKTIPVSIDEKGISVKELKKSGADIVHVSPGHHFPTGIVMPVTRRRELLDWAKESPSRFIIEDDYDSEFRFNGKPLPTLQSQDSAGKVIYMNTFSKTLAPSFRISYMVLPENLLSVFEEKLAFYTCSVSSFEQFTLARFISEGFFEKHLTRMKNYYRNLRNSLISAFENSRLSRICSIQEEEAGLHFLLNVNSSLSSEEISASLKKQGINAATLSEFFYGDAPEKSRRSFIINYSGIKKEQIPFTVLLMETALKSAL